MEALFEELQQRWGQMFKALAAGDDLPPAQRLRTEGLMEAAALLGADPRELQQKMSASHNAAFGSTLDEALGEGWETFHRFPEIPAFARRAPVYPTTGD